MKYIDEFRNRELIKRLSGSIKKISLAEPVNIMEVCGTHTQNFHRFGLDKLLPENIGLVSGPGCPVCVSSQEYIDRAILYARGKDTLILTFGDMLRVPGTSSTLEKERAVSGNVLVAYSPLDALTIARKNPLKKVIFLAVGFETTAPTIALSAILAQKEKLDNLFFFSSLKLIPPAMECLLRDKRLNIAAFLCPGHVSAIIGTKAYDFIPKKYGINCCVAGFEPLDILEGIYILIRLIEKNKPRIINQYARVVTRSGNLKAQRIISEVFEVADASWRGLGKISQSGLKLRKKFRSFDAENALPLKVKPQTLNPEQKLCRCADVLKGLIKPDACKLFKKICCPEHAVGPCMVSNEGACNAFYKYS